METNSKKIIKATNQRPKKNSDIKAIAAINALEQAWRLRISEQTKIVSEASKL